MKLAFPALAAIAVLAQAPPARAGQARCWLDNGVLIVSAEVMGIAGDYVLDTGQWGTQLHEAVAAAAASGGISHGEIRLAGLRLGGRPVEVADLDMRLGAFPTQVNGVIGASAFRGLVLELSFEPCRLRLSRPGQAPRPSGRRMKLAWRQGRPSIAAAVSDGPTALSGAFVPGTGGDAPVRVNDRFARVQGAPRPRELYPAGVARPRLRALSLGGELYENIPGGLMTPADDVLGEIGAPVLSRFRLRFDFARDELHLAPTKKTPANRGLP